MFCSKCGNELREGDSFCSKCGSEVNAQNDKVIHLTCQNCGSSMTFDDDKQIVACPYCGSKELLLESDDVKIERIKSNTVLERDKIANDFYIEKQKYEEDKMRRTNIECLKIAAILLAILVFAFVLIFILN